MNLKEVYDAMEGKYDDVLRRIPSEDSIIRFLKKFRDSGDFTAMTDAFDKKDYRRVFETSHNLKGLCGNLSLSKLAKSCTEVCEAVRHGEPTIDIAPMIEAAKADYEQVVNAINKLN